MNRFFKVLICLFFVTNSYLSLGQNEISFEINRNVFKDLGEFLITEDGAMLKTMIVPGDFQNLINEAKGDKSFGENVEMGFIEGTKIFFIQEVEQKNEEVVFTLLIMKKAGENQIINLMAFMPNDKKENYYQMIVEAAKSAKIIEE
ncbi:hypothetical protein [Hanstruepera neustonica]|nr:hypothetical protein [Hanstruepera neustonica]